MPRNEIQKATAAYRQSIDKRERAAVRATLRAYRLAIAHADTRIEQLRAGLEARPDKEWRSYAIQQQERLRVDLEARLTIAAKSSGKEIDTQRVNAYADANKITRRAVSAALTTAGHAEVATAFQGGISERAINAALAQLTKKSAVTDMLERHSKAGAKAAADRLITAVATGENPRKIVGSLRSSLQHEPWKALRIARTEIIRAHTAGAMDLMRENPDITPMYEWVAETGAACAACLAEHGTISSVSVDPARHPNCRCVMLPIVIDPTTGKPLSQPEETGQDVIDRMSMSEAKDRFGIRRGALLKAPDSNRVPLADMVRIKRDKTWGDSVAIVPLRELAK